MALASMEWSRALHGFEPYKKRLRYDIAKRWTHGMFSSLRHITCVPNRGVEAAYDVHSRCLVCLFPLGYPFKSIELQMAQPWTLRTEYRRQLLIATHCALCALQRLSLIHI